MYMTEPPARQLRRVGRHQREVQLKFDSFHPLGFRAPRRISLGQIPLNFAVSQWNLLPAEIANLGAADFGTFRRKIGEIEIFSRLEARQTQLLTKIPPLQRFYANL